jgi:hypothetical protein
MYGGNGDDEEELPKRKKVKMEPGFEVKLKPGTYSLTKRGNGSKMKTEEF